jgi:hypothetical protein
MVMIYASSSSNGAEITQVLVTISTQGFFVYRIYICALDLRICPFFYSFHSVGKKNILGPALWVRSLDSKLFPVLRLNLMCSSPWRFFRRVRLYSLQGTDVF